MEDSNSHCSDDEEDTAMHQRKQIIRAEARKLKPGRKLKTKQGEVGISMRVGKNSSMEVF
jgi:hypothetical protein